MVVFLFGLLNVLAVQNTTLIAGYILDNGNDDVLCRSRAIARAGNTEVGRGMVTGGRYWIELFPGWEQYGGIDILVYDNAPVVCTGLSTNAIKANITLGKQESLDLTCGFENINCWYYYSTDVEGTGNVYQSKFPAEGRVPGRIVYW